MLNDRPSSEACPARGEAFFEELDRPELAPLPPAPYAYAEWKKARVNIDYHVEVERHYYSVPHPLRHKQVDVRLAAKTLELLLGGKRVAAHIRSYRVGGFTTDPSHRPGSHQRHLDWSPDRLIRWGQSNGSATGALAQRIIEGKPHPEQGYRVCLGLMRLAKRNTAERLDAACFRALRSDATRNRSVKSIIEHGLDQVPLVEAAQLDLPTEHNVRGANYTTADEKR